jgi:beta-phosphoglucomutase
MIKAVLFDLDGVLVDAVDLHQKAFIEALRPYKEIDEEYHMEHLNGLPTKKKLEKLRFNSDLIEEINKNKQEMTFKLIRDTIKSIPEVDEVIEFLKRKEIKFAVCSNSIRKSVELFLETINVRGYEFIISNQEVIHPKPDPEMYIKAIRMLCLKGIKIEEILIVEDSPRGIEAAEKSGVKVCKIKNPYDIKKVLLEIDDDCSKGEEINSLEKIKILTHRGLEPSNKNFHSESSIEAFRNHLERGFGIEFDVGFVKDGIIISHDSNLSRITEGRDTRQLKDLNISEIKNISLGKKGDRLATLEEVLWLIKNNKSKINALHLKGRFQKQHYLDVLISCLKKYPETISRILIFDVKPDAARYLRSRLIGVKIAPSVAHEYDIKRYGSLVFNTLITIEEAIKYKTQGLYDWVWLDEWDTLDENNKKKVLYTKENFDKLKKEGYKISLVAPELHGISPGVEDSEAHKDAESSFVLFNKVKDLLNFEFDAICTNYPKEVTNIYKSNFTDNV